MKSFLVLLISVFSLSLFQAQPLSKYTFENNIEVGDERFEIGDFYNALDLYKMAYKERKDPNVTLRIAEAYYMLKDYKHAQNFLKKLLKKDKTGMFFHAKLLNAKCLKRLGKYQEAFNEFKEFAQKTDDPDARKEAILEIKGLELFNAIDENVEMEFVPLGKNINKGFSVYGVQKRNNSDEIYLGSFDRSSKLVLDGKKSKDDTKNTGSLNDEPKEKKKKRRKRKKSSKEKKQKGNSIGKIMLSKRDNSGEYGAPKALDKRINRIETHSLYPAFSSDGNTMYYTRVAMEGTKILESKLFMTEDNGGEWSAPYELENVNGDFHSKMPAVGEMLGQKALFFVSNMEGSKGGFDIFYSLINDDGSMSPPVNLGSKINTVDDELTPYYVDGKLYFSTNGLPGLGGFDIFKSQWNGKEWSTPENIGKGFNSSLDDIGLSISADGRSGFLLSNRPYKSKKKLLSETCCNHVYKISARDLIIKLLVEVFDENGKLNNAVVELVDLSKVKPNPPKSKSNFSGNTFNMLLDSDKPYKAIVSRKGYEPGIIEFNTAGIFDDFTIEKKITLVKAEPEVEVITINQAIRLNNIYYDYDDDKILSDAEKDLATLMDLMLEYPEMVIELSSHTDVRGPEKYNIKLSQRRAESAKRWLVENGIESERIKPVGYGESQILNHCKEGVDCSDDEHRFNRRTEFKILKGPKEITIKKEVFKNKK